jgi:hypothetical protein
MNKKYFCYLPLFLLGMTAVTIITEVGSTQLRAEDKKPYAVPSNAPQNGAPQASAPSRSVNLNAPSRTNDMSFDDDLVVGMNANPFDSLTHIGRKEDRDQGALYRKKASFKREISGTAQEMGYVQ